MFFNKKKDPNAPSKKSKKPEKESARSEPLSKDEMQRLEDTKSRLFGGIGKSKKAPKTGSASAEALLENGQSSQASLAGSQQPQQPQGLPSRKPVPPPRPLRLRDVPPDRPPPPPPPPISQQSGGAAANIFGQASSFGAQRESSVDESSPLSPAGGGGGGGDEFGFHPLKAFDMPGLNLPALRPVAPTERVIVLRRSAAGDFGFSLRRAQLVERFADATEQRRTVIFAEPAGATGPLLPSARIADGLVPGDQLLAVDARSTADLTRDDVIRLIREAGETVTLTVRPVPELSELTHRHQRPADADAAADDHLQLADANGAKKKQVRLNVPDDEGGREGEERVWLAHRAGYAAARLLGPGDTEGKVRIKLLSTGDHMLVDSDDIDKANDASLDRAEDLGQLIYLNESAALHVLRQRFGSNLVHTYAGARAALVLQSAAPQAAYHERVAALFRGCKREHLPPHIYAVGQQLYRQLQATASSQAVVFTGRSGSGKTNQARHLLHYLVSAAASPTSKTLTVEKLAAIGHLLDAFGNCRTALNVNASRFATVFTLDFDHCSQVAAASVQALLLESHRVVRRAEGESNFHVFHYLWHGADAVERSELQLDSIEDPGALLTPLETEADRETARVAWQRLGTAFEAVGVAEGERRVVWSTLAAALHLARAEATKGVASFKSQFLRAPHAQRAAALLGVTADQLHRAVFHSSAQQADSIRQTRPPPPNGSAAKRNSERPKLNLRSSLEKSSVTDRVGDGVDALNAFVVGLYRELFHLVVFLINRSVSSNARTLASIVVVDCPGLQNPAEGVVPTRPSNQQQGKARAASFSEFFYNYANERLLQLHHRSAFTTQLELYEQENVAVDFDAPQASPDALVQLIDKPSRQDLVHSTNIELRSQEKRGLLWLLDEESIFPGATDESFLERLFVHYGDRRDALLRKSRHYNHFVLRHALGTFPVTYSAVGWLKLAQESPVTRAVLPLLQDSTKDELASLFLSLRSGASAGMAASGVDSVASLRRFTTVLKSLNNPQALKRKSYCALFKVQMDCIVETVRRVGRCHFVHCMLPRAGGSAADDAALLDVPLLRSQLRGCQLLEAVRLNKIGFPERMTYGEFKRRFDCLADGAAAAGGGGLSLAAALDDKRAANDLLKLLDVDPTLYRLGLSQVFLRSDLLSQLEDRRDEKLSDVVTAFQAQCRTWLARRRFEKRKVADMAARCIQRNVSKYAAVQAWPWWRLYTKVLPLLDVHRTDEQLRTRADEIDVLRAKVDKLEKLVAELRLSGERAEARLDGAQAELAEERAAAAVATDALESESAERVRAERELTGLRARLAAAERHAQRLEFEVLEYRNLKAALPADDDGDSAALRQQLEALRKQSQQGKLDLEEQLHVAKKAAEKKLGELNAEVEDERAAAATQRRRAQHALDELQDVRLHLEQTASKNADLEKRQRRFDSELKTVRDEVILEKMQKERMIKEKEETLSKCYRVEQQLKSAEAEADDNRATVGRLQRDLDELATTGAGDGESDVARLRRERTELERRCAEQEEELDELAGRAQQADANATRLQMAAERARQDHQRDSDAREHEMEQIRQAAQRKTRVVEQQLEEELEEKASLVRQKRDLEARLQQKSEVDFTRDDATEAQLRRDLRKTRALLRDAQTVLQHYKDNAPSRGMLKQLKNQLEDAEFGRLSAVKARQALDADLEEARGQLDAALAAKAMSEDRFMQTMKEKNGLAGQREEMADELQQLLKQYRAQVQQASVDNITLSDQIQQIADLEREKEKLKEQLTEAQSHSQWQDAHTVDKHKLLLAEAKARQLQAQLDAEQAAHLRLEASAAKERETAELARAELAGERAARDRELELNRRLKQDADATRDLLTDCQQREADAAQKHRDAEAALERAEQEHEATLGDLKLAMRRLDGLQAALHDQLDDADSDDDDEAIKHSHSEDRPSTSAGYPSNYTSPVPQSGSTAGSFTGRADSVISEPANGQTSTPALIK